MSKEIKQKPYIEVGGKRYEFELNRRVLVELSRIGTADGVKERGVEFLEDAAFIMLNAKYGLERGEFNTLLDDYCKEAGNVTEIYELLTAVMDVVFTESAGKPKTTNNAFLAEYRVKKEAKEAEAS
jgi:hypothetical protein